MSDDAMIQVSGLKKYFHIAAGELRAVDGLDFKITRGNTIGIVGESGCGKSTLGRLLAMLLKPDSGSILFDGIELTAINGKKQLKPMRRRVQMIFQDPFSSLNPRMTTFDTIIEPLKIHGVSQGAEREEKVYEIMDTVGLSERFVNSYPHELDGGRRQRIGIARALALNPEFIVCDEPVSALDVSVQAQILNLLKTLQQRFGYTYMFITHDLAVVKHISHEVLVMYLGEMVEKAPTRELFKNPRHPYTKALMSAIPTPSVHGKKSRILLEGELTSPINPKPSCRFAPRCDKASERCRSQSPGLTDLGGGHHVRCFLEQNPKGEL
jgi:peptide/nickel transport system ATP-binding protein